MRSFLSQFKKIHFLIFSYVLSILVSLLVYYTGGTRYAFVMFMNIPIIIATSTNGSVKGLIHALISGLLVGPIMPLDVSRNVMQDPQNWMIRLIFFLTMSIIINIFVGYYKKEYEKNNIIEKEISESHLSTIYALVKLSESRDDETGNHIERVALLSKMLTEKLRELPKYQHYINDTYIDSIYKASMLHDIGKVGIPDHILLKPGKLTSQEFDVIKNHPTIGGNILKEILKNYPNNKFIELGYNIVLYHHEKWDGTGYPKGLSNEDIPLSARIMALVDVYDALRSKRIYKEASSHSESLDVIKNGKGIHFDPEIVDVFMKYENEFERLFDEITEKYK